MACEVCGHTMQKVSERPVWWCPRCGTLLEMTGEFRRVETPKWSLLVASGSATELKAEWNHALEVAANANADMRREQFCNVHS